MAVESGRSGSLPQWPLGADELGTAIAALQPSSHFSIGKKSFDVVVDDLFKVAVGGPFDRIFAGGVSAS